MLIVFTKLCSMIFDMFVLGEYLDGRGALLSVFPRNGPLAPFNDSEYDVVSVSWTVNTALHFTSGSGGQLARPKLGRYRRYRYT